MLYRFGKVSNAEIVMNERGSKGFGFVTLDSKQSSEAARSALNGTVVNGRVIEVSIVRGLFVTAINTSFQQFFSGFFVKVKKATAMPPRRNFTISRPQPPPAPGPSVLIPPGSTDLFSSRQLPQVQPRSFVYTSPAERLNSLLVAQNQLGLQCEQIVSPTYS
uniref:RRM domain-containing protein n=1 Tax=Angiostrongylus cantonensis TaxID=6313 RepID=A0A0K0CWB8_ANGCA